MSPSHPETDSPVAPDYPNCFGCGTDNYSGLRLDLKLGGEYLTTEFTPQRRHEGWPGIVHGGVIAAILYEVMENWPYLNGVTTMMRSMNTRLVSPAAVGEPMRAVSWLKERDGRDLSVGGRLTAAGRTIAEGTASLVELSYEQRQRLGI